MQFSDDHNKFLLEAYFRSGEIGPKGEWKYSIILCMAQFRTKFPDVEFDSDGFTRHVHRLAKRFRETGSICKRHSTGRPTVLTNEVLERVQKRLDVTPTKSLRRLAEQTGLSYGTCRTARMKLQEK